MVTNPAIPVIINDDRNISFYSTADIMPVYCFNLPSGKYIVESGEFKPMPKPIPFKLEKEPIAETALPTPPIGFDIVFGYNPNKCTIFWGRKLIVFSDQFIDYPLPKITHIYMHEFGHSKYGFERLYDLETAEKYCDLYASNQMLRMGYNPSQIMSSEKETLSDRQQYRKDFIEGVLLKNAYSYEPF